MLTWCPVPICLSLGLNVKFQHLFVTHDLLRVCEFVNNLPLSRYIRGRVYIGLRNSVIMVYTTDECELAYSDQSSTIQVHPYNTRRTELHVNIASTCTVTNSIVVPHF